MATKQNPGSVYAPDGSLYITLTDGAGNLASAGGSSTITANSTTTSGFTAGKTLISDGSKIQAANRGWVTLKQVNVEQPAVTGTTSKTTTWSMTIPGGTINANGRFRVTPLFKYSGGNGSWTIGCDYGGTTFWQSQALGNTVVTALINGIGVANRGATNSQIGITAININSNIGAFTGANVTSSIDTTADQTVSLWVTLLSGSDSVSVESVIVEYNNDAP